MKRIKVLLFAILVMILGLTACGSDAEEIEWKNIVLGDVIPEPQSNLMEIFTNDDEALDVYIHNMSENDFLEYVGWCEEQKDFNIDTEKDTSSFSGYNQEGYYLSLYYDDSEDEMNIDLQIPIVLEEFEFPSYATSVGLPIPKSNLGQYTWNSEDGFILYVGNTTIDDFSEYKNNCVKAGFTVDPFEYENYYSAKNSNGYEFVIEYKGFNRVEIRLYCPETEESETEQDDTKETEQEETEKQNTEKNDTEIDTTDEEESEDVVSNLTIENNADLKALLELKDPSDPSVSSFANKYSGQIIEFDGCVVSMQYHGDYDTRFDILIGAGDFDENVMRGPNFRLTDVNAYDMELNTLWLEDVLSVGTNIHIIAEVGEYNPNSSLFELDVIKVEVR